MTDFSDYCAAVCAHVRSHPDRPAIADELAAHLEDHADFLRAQGANAAEAERQAVEAMGDPAEVGKELNRLHTPIYYRLYQVFAGLAILCALTFLFLALRPGAGVAADRWFDFTPVETVLSQNHTLAPLATGTVSGGGALGDYSLSPAGDAWLVEERDINGVLIRHKLCVPIRVFHWQPWLPDLDGNLVPAAVGGGPSDPMLGIYHPARLYSYHLAYWTVTDLKQSDYTLTLGQGSRAVSFAIHMEGGG